VKSLLAAIILAGIIMLIACNPHPGFEDLGQGIYLRRISFEETSEPEKATDKLLEIKARYFSGDEEQKKGPFACNEAGHDTIDTSKLPEPLRGAMKSLKAGDSVHLFLEPGAAETYLNILPGASKEPTQIHIKVLQSEDIPLSEKRKKEKEEEALMRYIQKSGKQWEIHSSGIYIHWIAKTDSLLPTGAHRLSLLYTGRFLNGRVFDDAGLRGQYLEYTPGTQNQLIRGLEIAVSAMPLGSHAEIIIPWNLAFGKEGSSTGIVGPYKMVIFDLQLKTHPANNI
jgi:FKBP-type peptidyl-prolyl cis-trans isomerase